MQGEHEGPLWPGWGDGEGNKWEDLFVFKTGIKAAYGLWVHCSSSLQGLALPRSLSIQACHCLIKYISHPNTWSIRGTFHQPFCLVLETPNILKSLWDSTFYPWNQSGCLYAQSKILRKNHTPRVYLVPWILPPSLFTLVLILSLNNFSNKIELPVMRCFFRLLPSHLHSVRL